MTKKKGNAKAKRKTGGARKSGPVTASDVMLMPPTETVTSLAKRKRSAKKSNAETNGALGNAIAKAADEKHLDRKAFSMACQLDGMSDERLAVTLPHLRRYIDDLGLDERATAQAELFEEGAEKVEEGDGKPRIVAGRDTEETAGEAAAAG